MDGAKKRYSSLRQKYCREKRNEEVKRRNKCAIRRYWIYYDRLHFLDSFIQPRSYVIIFISYTFDNMPNSCFRTYTNDTLFVEDDDERGSGVDVDDASNIDIQLEDGIDINELRNIDGADENSGVERNGNLRITATFQNYHDNDQRDHENLADDVQEMATERILSDYSGEMSRIDYVSQPFNVFANDNSDSDDQTAEDNHQSTEQIDADNYISPEPGTSSSQVLNQPLARNDSTAGKNTSARDSSITTAINRPEVTKQLPPNHPKANDTRSSSQQKSSTINPSATQKTLQKNTTVRPNTSSTQKSASSRTDATSELASALSKEKRIEAIRVRMESCLTAITNKVTEKAQRSPHAPFLAYLGTKLPNVPKEFLPSLEREILELVEFHSKTI